MIKPDFLSRFCPEIMIAVALSLLVAGSYWPVGDHGFINYDDPLYVTDNAHVKMGFTAESLVWAFQDFGSSNWHPLTWLSHITDWQLFQDNAGGHHWMNVIFHMLNAILLFYVLHMMTGAPWRSACVAALFAVHPINVESVAWIAERKNLLSTFFGLLTLLCYVHYIRKPDWKRYLLILWTFALGLTTKPMLVTLPFLMIVIDYWPGRRFPGRSVNGYPLLTFGEAAPHPNPRFFLSTLLLEKIPLILLSVLSIAVTLQAAEKGGALKSLDHFSLAVRLGNSLNAYAAYIRKFFWPQDLAVFYPHSGILHSWRSVSALFLISAVTVIVLRQSRRRPYLPVGWFWFLGTLVPVIGLVQVGLQAMADRYAYFPMIGLFIMLIWGAADLRKQSAEGRVVLISLLIIVISTAALWTRYQLRYWQNSRMLFEHALDVTGANPVASSNLAHALFGERDWKGAEAHYREAIRSDPKYSNAYDNLGAVLASQGRISEAISEYRKALLLNPRHATAHYHLGLAMESLGRFNEADASYKTALREKPDYADPLQKILDRKGH